ncbi:MAG: phosphoribosylglycinamide formyltransferase [Dehalococcoidia bacterium]
MELLRLGFLSSHGGSNVQAIVDACKLGHLKAELCVVISNNSESKVIERARQAGIPHYHLSEKTHPISGHLDKAIKDTLEKHETNLVILAGYMKLLGPQTLTRFRGRILNIHPALLPKFGGKGMYGKSVHEAVLKAGEQVTGVTIHMVDEEYDHGSTISQCKVPVLDNDTVDSLMERVLEKEHEFYVQTLQRISEGVIKLP